MAEAYPLEFPSDQSRTAENQRQRAVFQVSFAQARDELLAELDKMKAVKIVVSSHIPLRRDGLPYANQREPDDPGVAVYFDWNQRSFCFACDGWDRVKDNLRDIGLTIQAKRLLAQQRKTVTARREFAGYQALPAADLARPWWEVLGVPRTAHWEEVRSAYRRKAQTAHPDKGGDRAKWDKIQAAYRQAEETLKPQGAKP